MKKKIFTFLSLIFLFTACLPVTAQATELQKPVTSQAGEAGKDGVIEDGTPYDEDGLTTGTGEPGKNHALSIILVDESGTCEGDVPVLFADVTGVHSKTIIISEDDYKSGRTVTINLVSPGTYTIAGTLPEGYMLCETLSGEVQSNYAAYGTTGILLLSIKQDVTEQTEAQEQEETQQSVILSGAAEETEPVGEGNEEAQELYKAFLEAVKFIETDETWAKTIHLRQIKEPAYDYAIPDGAYQKKDYESLSEFDRFLYHYTYCVFSVAKQSPNGSWETKLRSPEAFAGIYSDLLTFEDTQGADSYNGLDEVNAAFQSLWDFQYEYCLEYGEPYNFIDDCSYSEMGFGISGSGVTTETETAEESTEAGNEEQKETAGENITEENTPETETAASEAETESDKEEGLWDGVFEILAKDLFTLGLLLIAVIALAVVLIKKRRKNIDEDTEE